MNSDEQVTRVAEVFDLVAPEYDNVGVDFFGPIADFLVREARPLAGESVLDLGCGAGAATVRLARAVLPAAVSPASM